MLPLNKVNISMPNETDARILAGDLVTPYGAGSVARKLFCLDCSVCNEKMTAHSELQENTLIKYKQFEHCNLVNPSSTFTAAFSTLCLLFMLPYVITTNRIKEQLISNICRNNFVGVFCTEYCNYVDVFIKITINIILFRDVYKNYK